MRWYIKDTKSSTLLSGNYSRVCEGIMKRGQICLLLLLLLSAQVQFVYLRRPTPTTTEEIPTEEIPTEETPTEETPTEETPTEEIPTTTEEIPSTTEESATEGNSVNATEGNPKESTQKTFSLYPSLSPSLHFSFFLSELPSHYRGAYLQKYPHKDLSKREISECICNIYYYLQIQRVETMLRPSYT